MKRLGRGESIGIRWRRQSGTAWLRREMVRGSMALSAPSCRSLEVRLLEFELEASLLIYYEVLSR